MSQDNEHPLVLVIDDEPDIRDGCERILVRMGCRVAKASNGRDGLDLLAREPAAVVLLDLKMPGLSGIEVLPRIKQSHPDTLVIMITGYATLETAVEAMKLGAYDFIPKPFQPDQLRITVGRALERIKLAAEARRLERERRRTLADLHQEQSRIRTIIRALPLGVLVTDPQCNVVLMNPAFRSMVGLEPEAQPGRHLAAYLEDEAGLCRLVEDLAREPGGEQRSLEFSPDGQKQLLAQGTVITGDEGEHLGAVLVVMDISPFKAMEELSSEFVAKVSHDLRSPLSTIYLQLSLLLGEGEGQNDPKSRQLLERARQRTQSLIHFVRDIMEISRIESQGAGQAEPVGLEEVLQSAVEGHLTQAENKKQSLELHLPATPLPPLLGDRLSLESVFNNLISNAVNYTPQGGSINVSARQEGDRLVVEVADTGLGIPQDKLEAIFDKFYRVKTEKTRYITGTGLGLPIVKSVVDNMGGEIEVKSELEVGTTFIVSLPLAPAPD